MTIFFIVFKSYLNSLKTKIWKIICTFKNILNKKHFYGQKNCPNLMNINLDTFQKISRKNWDEKKLWIGTCYCIHLVYSLKFCGPDSETLTSNTREPVGLSHKNGGYRGSEPLFLTQIFFEKFTTKKYFLSLKSSETCQKKISSKSELIFISSTKFFNFFFGRTHNHFWLERLHIVN